MPTREELIRQVRRKRLMEDVQAKRDAENFQDEAQGSDDDAFDRVPTRDSISFSRAKPIGARIPILGPLAEQGGEYLGAGLASIYPGGEFSDNLEKIRRINRESEARFADEHPYVDTALDVLGGVALPVAPAFTAVKGAGALAKTGNWLANLGARAGEAGTVSYADSKVRGLDASERRAGESAVFSASLGLGGKALQGAGKFVRRYVMGVPGETANKYRARSKEINKIDERNLVEELDASKGRLVDDVAGSKESLAIARQDRRLAEQSLSEESRDAIISLQSHKTAAERQMIADMRGTRPPEHLPRELFDSVGRLGREVSEGSSQAFDILGKSDRRIGIGPIKGHLTEGLERRMFGKALPDTPETKMLTKQLGFLNESELTSLSAVEMKRYVQLLDEDVGNAYAKLGINQQLDSGDKALIKYRRFVDATIKDIPEYAEAMLPLAEKTKLLGEARRILGNESRTFGLLRKLNSPENAADRKVIERLGEIDGKNYVDDLLKYEWHQAQLKDPTEMTRLKNLLPESKAYRDSPYVDKALMAKRRADLPEVGRQASSEESLARSVGALAPVKALNSQAAVRRAASEGRPDFKAQDRLKYLGQLDKRDYLQDVDDLGIQRGLSTGFTRGSRNVNLASKSLGGLLGLLVGPRAKDAGEFFGTIAGGIADLSGPKAYKFIADISMNPKFIKYERALTNAISRGPNVFTAVVNGIAERDHEFRAAVYREAGSEEQASAMY